MSVHLFIACPNAATLKVYNLFYVKPEDVATFQAEYEIVKDLGEAHLG